jgi:3-methyladenine DNA glycosylase AlkD
MARPSEIADAIESRLRAAGTSARAQREKQYLKSSLEHLGATVGAVRSEAKRAAKELSSREELIALASALWDKPVHERRTATAFLLHIRADLAQPPADIVLIERLIRESKTWALVDVLAGDALGALLLRHPQAEQQIDAWAADEDFWVRRAALLSQRKPLKAGASFERFAGYADRMLEEREFFVRKAIGWVLRETGRRRPEEVVAWLLPRAHRASGVTLREAVKYLPESDRVAILAAARR